MGKRHLIIDSKLWNSAYKRFQLDLRGLAVFRVSIGIVTLIDIILRSRSLFGFYTNVGVLPQSALFSDYSHVYSIHALSGSAWVQISLFIIGMFFSIVLIVGYRPRLAALCAWLFVYSLHTRNPMVLNSGDTLLRLLLLWSVFLPLGMRWSLSTPEYISDRTTIFTPATACILLQVWFVYGVNAVHKLRGSAWLTGDAVGQIFQLGQLTVLLGPAIAQSSTVLTILNYAWIGLLVASPLLLLSAGPVRTILTTILIGSHVGMLLTMQLGVFPLVSISGLLLFYPSSVWDHLTTKLASNTRWQRMAESGIRVQQRVHNMADWNRLGRESNIKISSINHKHPKLFYWPRIVFFRIIPLILFAGVALWISQSVGAIEILEPTETAIETVGVDQSWQMFAPEPLSREVWYVAPGVLTNGSKVDVYDGGTVNFSRPSRVDQTYRTARWRKYLENVRTVSNKRHRSYYAHYLCHRWNRSHGYNLRKVSVYTVSRPVGPDTRSTSRQLLTRHDCGGELIQ